MLACGDFDWPILRLNILFIGSFFILHELHVTRAVARNSHAGQRNNVYETECPACTHTHVEYHNTVLGAVHGKTLVDQCVNTAAAERRAARGDCRATEGARGAHQAAPAPLPSATRAALPRPVCGYRSKAKLLLSAHWTLQ